MVQAKDPDAYIATLKKNPAPFIAIGSSVAGACVTKTGHDYPGQMFIFNGFASFEEAMAATDKYDAMKATPELMAIREVKYNVMFKPLKEYTLEPGSERLWRLKISTENLQAYVNKIAELETALRAAGHKINVGVFQPIGGGVHEAIHLRGGKSFNRSFRQNSRRGFCKRALDEHLGRSLSPRRRSPVG